MTEQTIDKLRDASRWYKNQNVLDAYNYFQKYGEHPFETFYKTTQAVLKYIDTEGGWMPIESCPDGEEVLLKFKDGEVQMDIWLNDIDWYEGHKPIKWMPLKPSDRLLQMIEGGE